MADTHETIADIVAEKRALADRLEHEMTVAKECKELIAHRTAQAIIDSTRREADRLEAAIKREIEATAAKCCQLGRLAGYGASEIKHQQEPVGDAAKLREALSDACYAMFNFLKRHPGGYKEMANAFDKAKAALAESSRNCDGFVNKTDAQDEILDWLPAPETEKEGGAK